MTPTESRLLARLDRLSGGEDVRAHVDGAAKRLQAILHARPGAQMAWETVPLSLFGPGMPETIRSCWVFILRAGVTTGAERHPNSHQRSLSWRGSGDFQILVDGRWVSHRLAGGRRAPWSRRWASIPTNIWHQWVVPGRDWVVVSFHTALPDDLIEERPRTDAAKGSRRRLYAGESAR